MVLAVTGFHRTPRKAQAKHQGNEDDYENDFTVGQANHIMRIVLAFFTVLPPSLRTVRLVLHATGKITKEQAVSLRLNIGRMMWFELGKRLWGAPKLECIALHITGVDDGCIWDDEETGTAIWVREALIEGAYSPTNVQRTCPTFMAFQGTYRLGVIMTNHLTPAPLKIYLRRTHSHQQFPSRFLSSIVQCSDNWPRS